MDDFELNSDFWNADGSPIDSSSPIASTGKNDSTSIWGQLGSSLLSSTGSVLSQQLKNNQQTALAKAQAKSSSGTIQIVLLIVAGLAVVGIIFAVLKRK